PERLVQVFENLLDNAIGFSPDGGTVRVELGARDGVGVVEVADQGPGVPPELLPRAFDRFVSYRPAAEPAEPGRNGHSGLGLAIVKAIVEGYGGRVALANRPGGGAAAEVRLPLC
ncbi:MAG: sensor histidine kinase, partial [Thermoanaerobaculia bacterium]